MEGNRRQIWLNTGRLDITYINVICIWTKMSGAEIGDLEVSRSWLKGTLALLGIPTHPLSNQKADKSNTWSFRPEDFCKQLLEVWKPLIAITSRLRTKTYSQNATFPNESQPLVGCTQYWAPENPDLAWFGIESVEICSFWQPNLRRYASPPVPSLGAAVGCWCGRQIGPRPRWPQDPAIITTNNWLVGATYPSEKYEFVNWDDEIPDIWENRLRLLFQPGVLFLIFLKRLFPQGCDVTVGKQAPTWLQKSQGLPYSLSKLAEVQTKHWSCNLKAVKNESNIVQLCTL